MFRWKVTVEVKAADDKPYVSPIHVMADTQDEAIQRALSLAKGSSASDNDSTWNVVEVERLG